jgi:hypothetical protein
MRFWKCWRNRQISKKVELDYHEADKIVVINVSEAKPKSDLIWVRKRCLVERPFSLIP